MNITKFFTAEAEITGYCPVKQGSKEGTVVPATSSEDYVIGIAQKNTTAGDGVDVVIIGETLVNCEGAVDGTMPLVANSNGKAEQLDLTSESLGGGVVCPFARPIELNNGDAYLRCIVSPYLVSVAAKG